MVLGRYSTGVAQATPVTFRRIAGRASLGAVAVALLLLALGLMASSALATPGHYASGQIGSGPANDPGTFNSGGPGGVAVDQAGGDVFVSDPGHTDSDGAPIPRVERFDSTGTFQSEFAIDPAYNTPGTVAIDPSGPDLYVGVVDGNFQGAVLKYSTTGTLEYPLDASTSNTTISNPVSIAVDPADGTVYVSAADANGVPVIDVFDNAGAFQSTITGASGPGAAFGSISSLAVDGQSRLYVVDPTNNRVDRYDSSGTFQATIDDGSLAGPFRVAADASSDEVYVLETNPNGQQQVAWLSAGGATRLETFGVSVVSTATGVAVNEGDGTVLVSDNDGINNNLTVHEFATFPGPTVTTGPAAALDAISETVSGTVNPEGNPTFAHFEVTTDPSNGTWTPTPDIDVGTGTADVPVTDTAAGLLPNTNYRVRLVGTQTVNGLPAAIYGDEQTFTTLPAPPLVDSSGATPVTSDGATLNGSFNPQGSSTDVSFEYGPTTAYGTTTATETFPGEPQTDTAVTSVPITGLQPGTTYHYRLNAFNGTGGVQSGPDQTFTTAPAAPAGATSVTGVTAALSGAVNPPDAATSYVFEYGLTTSYSSTTPPKDVAANSGGTTFTANIARLTPGTTYHVRVVAIDAGTGARTEGVDGTFTTDPAPLATTGAVTGVGTDRAAFSGTFDTHGLGGTYQFVVASSTSTYLGQTEPKSVAAAGDASDALTGLLPGQTYTVRIAVTSSGVTTLGDTVTFSTPPEPPVAPPPPPPAASANPYGCVTPTLAAYDKHPKPGDTITVTGADLGVGGSVVLGTDTLTPTFWGVTGFTVTLPDDAKGTLPLTINCGTVSNTIAIAMYQAPSNTITASGKVKGTTATIKVKVPGPGSISIRSGHVKTATKHAAKATTYSVKVTLNAAAVKSLKRHKKLAVSLSVRFTPTGGTTGTKTVKVTFKR